MRVNRPAPDGQSREDYLRQQQDQQLQQAALQQGMRQFDGRGDAWDDFQQLIESGVDPASANLVKSLLSRDMVLSNLTEAEVHESKWLLRFYEKKAFTMHPRQGSVYQGEFRACVSGDESNTLQALDDQDRAAIQHAFHVLTHGRVPRSRGGWQQEERAKIYAVSESRTKDDTKGGRIFG